MEECKYILQFLLLRPNSIMKDTAQKSFQNLDYALKVGDLVCVLISFFFFLTLMQHSKKNPIKLLRTTCKLNLTLCS